MGSTVIENIAGHFPMLDLSFYRTNHGNEVDIVLNDGSDTIVVECKSTLSPSLSKGNHAAIEDIAPLKSFVVIPADQGYPYNKDIDVVSLGELISKLPELLKV
ncbi:MAG: hypothetical protein U5K71_13140 [Gracilimonas sp.]|nr:hypothetical protein [Gracilimonas sp.]